MKHYEKEQEQQNMDDYQSYKITLELKGKMAPTREAVIRLLNSKRRVRL